MNVNAVQCAVVAVVVGASGSDLKWWTTEGIGREHAVMGKPLLLLLFPLLLLS